MAVLPESLEPLLNLAKVRELLRLDRDHCMPPAPGALEQRNKAILGIEHIIGGALADSKEPWPTESPTELDPVSARAFAYVAQVRPLPSDEPLPSAYANLKRQFSRWGDLDQANELIGWMEDTGLVPGVTDENLNDATAATKQFMGRLMAQDNVKQWLEQAQHEKLNEDDQRNLDLMKVKWTAAVGLGEKRIGDFERARSASYAAWRKEKGKADEGHPEQVDFNAWLPHFEAMLVQLREKAKALGEAFGVEPYQALMFDSNPGLSKETVDNVLGELGDTLPTLARTIIAKQTKKPQPIPLPEIDEADQMRVANRLMEALGLDKEHARVDQCAHPGSYMQWNEQRLTVRRGKRDLLSRMIGLIHESGHEIYAKNLPPDWKDQPIGNPQSMWVHESQSLFWEREVAFTKPFMSFLSNLIRDELGGKYDMNDPAWSSENLYNLVMKVLPDNPIRTEADDVTYPLHVIVRHELCPKLIDGSLQPKDLPRAWNEAYREKLGVEVGDDMKGCMQDMQMAFGNFAGFPGYTFGRLGTAMLGKKIREDMDDGDGRPDFDQCVEAGNFAPITKWLLEKIHRYGSRYEGVDLIQRATDMAFSAQPYLEELRERNGLREDIVASRSGTKRSPSTDERAFP